MAFATVTLPERLNTRAALFVTAPLPRVPTVPPLPTCRVPAETVVVPVYVLAAVSVRTLLPSWVRPPEPLTTPPNVAASVRLNARVPLFVTSPAMLPTVPPLPSWRVPAVMVVPPVYVLAVARVNVPVPDLVSEPAPPMPPVPEITYERAELSATVFVGVTPVFRVIVWLAAGVSSNRTVSRL